MGSNNNSNFLRKLEVLNRLIYNGKQEYCYRCKIGNLNELTKVLSVKEQAQEQLLVVMKALGIGKIVRNLKVREGSRLYLDLPLHLAPHHAPVGKTIASATSIIFMDFAPCQRTRCIAHFERPSTGECFTKITLRFHAIFREHQVDTDEHDTCAILDDTTFQKSGIRIEGVSKVFDHVTHNFIYGMKCPTPLSLTGKAAIP